MLLYFCNDYNDGNDLMNASIKLILNEKEISASYTRILIYEYLEKYKSHPTVNEIYQALHKELPTLSKTTVYNIISLFQKHRLVHDINVGTNEKRYELLGKPHYHFYCTACHKMYDIDQDVAVIDKSIIPGFEIIDQEINLKGICAQCKSFDL